jgi:hypothetical protein
MMFQAFAGPGTHTYTHTRIHTAAAPLFQITILKDVPVRCTVTVWYGTIRPYIYGKMQYGQTIHIYIYIHTAKYGTVTVRCQRLEIVYFLQRVISAHFFKCCDLQQHKIKMHFLRGKAQNI